MPIPKRTGAQLLQDWFKKDIIRAGTRIRVLRAPGWIGTGRPLWPTPLVATVKLIDGEDSSLPVGFVPDDSTLGPFGAGSCWWCHYDWIEILRPEDDPLNTQEVTPSQEVMTE